VEKKKTLFRHNKLLKNKKKPEVVWHYPEVRRVSRERTFGANIKDLDTALKRCY